MANPEKLLILYDGDCPICRRKVVFLQRRDKRGRLRFSDIRNQAFQPMERGIGFQTLERQIHAVLPDGTVVSGMDVIRAAYRETGLGWLAAPTGWPLFRPLFDVLYGFVARNRRAISRFFR